MTTYLGKSCSFCLPRVPFVNCRQFMYLVISLLVLRAGYGIWLYQFLIIAYLFTFQLEENIYIGFIYLLPVNSTLNINQQCQSFEYLKRDFCKFKEKGNVIVLGDMNARTFTLLDFILNDDDKMRLCPTSMWVTKMSTCRDVKMRIFPLQIHTEKIYV